MKYISSQVFFRALLGLPDISTISEQSLHIMKYGIRKVLHINSPFLIININKIFNNWHNLSLILYSDTT